MSEVVNVWGGECLGDERLTINVTTPNPDITSASPLLSTTSTSPNSPPPTAPSTPGTTTPLTTTESAQPSSPMTLSSFPYIIIPTMYPTEIDPQVPTKSPEATPFISLEYNDDSTVI